MKTLDPVKIYRNKNQLQSIYKMNEWKKQVNK